MLEYGILLLFVVFVFLVFRRYETRSVGIPFENSSRILFLIAHPDDECMFFSPSIIHFVESKKDVYLLCLSTGNKASNPLYHLDNEFRCVVNFLCRFESYHKCKRTDLWHL